MNQIEVRLCRAREHVEPLPLPGYQTPQAAGFDLCADIDLDVTLAPLERRGIPTGLRMEIPEGFEGQVRPRSGLALRSGITCLNSPGTVDSDYRGEVVVVLINLSQAAYTVRRGDRIAQMVLAPVSRAEFVSDAALSTTERSDKGFGSTGR